MTKVYIRAAMSREFRGVAAVLTAAAGYGTLAVLVKLALAAGAHIWPLIAWRFVIGAVGVWVWMAVSRRPAPPRRAIPALVGLGLLYSGNAIAFLLGLQWIPAATASLVFFTYPAVVVLIATLFLGERLTYRRSSALILTVGGCMLTAGSGLHGGAMKGILLILLAVILVSLFVTASHSVLQGLPTFGSSAVTLTSTATITVLAALAAGGLELGGGTRAAVLTGLLGLVATALPVTLFLTGIKLIGPARAAMYSTTEPAVTVLLAAWLLTEPISAGQVAGGCLILAGVLWLRTERPLT